MRRPRGLCLQQSDSLIGGLGPLRKGLSGIGIEEDEAR
jgi:hypothetical protein